MHEGDRKLIPDANVHRKIISEPILDKQCGKVWTGFSWLRIGTSGGLL
jgi:hypothetical protein